MNTYGKTIREIRLEQIRTKKMRKGVDVWWEDTAQMKE